MGETEWVMIGTAMFVQVVALIGTYIRIQIKLKELDMRIKNTESALNLHERQNERTFDKLEKKTDAIYDAINELRNHLIKK